MAPNTPSVKSNLSEGTSLFVVSDDEKLQDELKRMQEAYEQVRGILIQKKLLLMLALAQAERRSSQCQVAGDGDGKVRQRRRSLYPTQES